jgi:hypothetical protein
MVEPEEAVEETLRFIGCTCNIKGTGSTVFPTQSVTRLNNGGRVGGAIAAPIWL